MGTASIFKHMRIALALAALGSLVFTSIGAAQTTGTAAVGPLVLRVTTPNAGSRVAGTVTFSGVAVDCGSGAAASRVAVYDGTEMTQSTYLADVSIDTTRSLSQYCSNRTDSAQVGWRLIYNSRQLRDGPHTLAFQATFPGGATTSVTLDVIVDNGPPGPARYDVSGRSYDAYYDGYGYNPYYYGGGGGYNNSYYGGYNNSYGGGYYNNYYNQYSYNNNCYGYGSAYPYGYGYGYPTNYGGCGYYPNNACGGVGGGYTPSYNCSVSVTYPGGYYNSQYYYNPYYYSPYYSNPYNYPYYYNNYYNKTNPSGCAYPYYAYYGYYNSCNYNYGSSSITLHQAGQNVRIGQPSTLSGFATCGSGSATSVSVYDRSFGQSPIGTSTPSNGTYSVVWTPAAPTGSHTIEVVASGSSCGTWSQIFSVFVTN